MKQPVLPPERGAEFDYIPSGRWSERGEHEDKQRVWSLWKKIWLCVDDDGFNVGLGGVNGSFKTSQET